MVFGSRHIARRPTAFRGAVEEEVILTRPARRSFRCIRRKELPIAIRMQAVWEIQMSRNQGTETDTKLRVGWIGVGRMGFEMAKRLAIGAVRSREGGTHASSPTTTRGSRFRGTKGSPDGTGSRLRGNDSRSDVTV